MGAEAPGESAVARHVIDADAAIQQDLATLMERMLSLTAERGARPAASFQTLRARWQADADCIHAAFEEIAASLRSVR